jgi:hypothetical protein
LIELTKHPTTREAFGEAFSERSELKSLSVQVVAEERHEVVV